MTAHDIEKLIGLYGLCISAAILLVYGLVAWGTRDERRDQRHGLPLHRIQFAEYSRSARDVESSRREARR